MNFLLWRLHSVSFHSGEIYGWFHCYRWVWAIYYNFTYLMFFKSKPYFTYVRLCTDTGVTKQLETLQIWPDLPIWARHRRWMILLWAEHYCSREPLYWLTVLSEGSLKSVLGYEEPILSHDIALATSWPMVCDFFSSLLYAWYFFFVSLSLFFFWWRFSSECTVLRVAMCPQRSSVNFQSKWNRHITEQRYRFILFQIYGNKGLGKKGKVTYIKR